jgi:hypothetical protein
MSLQVTDLNLPADKLAQFNAALGGSASALQGICDGAAADVTRLTNGYVVDPATATNWGRAIALYRAYSQAQFGEIPKAIADDFKAVWDELTSISKGERKNMPRVDDGGTQATSTGGYGGRHHMNTGPFGADDCNPNYPPLNP